MLTPPRLFNITICKREGCVWTFAHLKANVDYFFQTAMLNLRFLICQMYSQKKDLACKKFFLLYKDLRMLYDKKRIPFT